MTQADAASRKRAARAAAAAARAALSPREREAAGAAATQRVLALPELRRPTRVLAYAATPSELPTAATIDALRAAGHAVALPVLTGGRSMRGRRVPAAGPVALSPGPRGVPSAPPADAGDADAWMDDPAVALVPGVAFDPASGARLGRGGGCYDAWLDAHPGVLAVGLAFEVQRLAGLPVEPHDRPVAVLVTEAQTIRFDR